MHTVLIGVDEAGRAPLAGPVAVGIVAAPPGFNFKKHFPGLNDSKQVAPRKREELYGILAQFAEAGELRFCVRFSSHEYIDQFGITRAVRRAVWNGVRYLAPQTDGVKVLLDGLLRAPRDYEQETIIRGDELVPIISLASIAAKVRRDRFMKRLARRYPQYGFERHKGYPTALHYARLAQHGTCAVHRQTYCKSNALAGNTAS